MRAVVLLGQTRSPTLSRGPGRAQLAALPGSRRLRARWEETLHLKAGGGSEREGGASGPGVSSSNPQ